MNPFGNVRKGRMVSLRSRLVPVAFPSQLAMPGMAHGFYAFPGHENRDAQEDDNESHAHDHIDMRGPLQYLNDLSARLNADDGSHYHHQRQFHVDVAQGAVLPGCDNRLAYDVREVGADYKIHRHPKRKECR